MHAGVEFEAGCGRLTCAVLSLKCALLRLKQAVLTLKHGWC